MLKTISVSEHVSQVIFDGPEPVMREDMTRAVDARAATDLIEVSFLGQGLATGSGKYSPPSMTYADLTSEFTGTNVTYSARSTFDRFIDEFIVGKFMSLQDFLSEFYPNAPMTMAEFLAMNDSIITLSSGGYTISILGSQINDGARSAFASEGAISGTQVDCGFVLDSTSGAIRFAIGQLYAAEQTSQMFVTLSDGGTTVKFHKAGEDAIQKWGTLTAHVGEIGSKGLKYPSGSGPITITTATNIRFNLDVPITRSNTQVDIEGNDYQNGARIYYTVNGNTPAPNVPGSVSQTGTIVNKQAPQYTIGGYGYPGAIKFDTPGQKIVRAVAYGQGLKNSDVYTIEFDVNNAK